MGRPYVAVVTGMLLAAPGFAAAQGTSGEVEQIPNHQAYCARELTDLP